MPFCERCPWHWQAKMSRLSDEQSAPCWLPTSMIQEIDAERIAAQTQPR